MLRFASPFARLFEPIATRDISSSQAGAGTTIPPTGPPPPGFAYVADTSQNPIWYETTEDGDYVIAPLEA